MSVAGLKQEERGAYCIYAFELPALGAEQGAFAARLVKVEIVFLVLQDTGMFHADYEFHPPRSRVSPIDGRKAIPGNIFSGENLPRHLMAGHDIEDQRVVGGP